MFNTIAIGSTPRAGSLFATAIRFLAHNLAVWRERAQARYALREMDDRMLADIGLTRAAAGTEARKFWWQA